MNDKLEQILQGLPFTLTEEQLNFIYQYINGRGHFSLLAPAGAGKSLIISVLKKYYGDEMALSAATGVANQNLLDQKGGDGTAHRVWSLPFDLGDEMGSRKVKTACSNIFAGSDLVKHVVVDEFYMMNPEHLNIMLNRVRRFNKATKRRGSRSIRILGVGDCLQIPSVLSDQDKKYLVDNYGSHLMFRSKVWDRFNPTLCVLKNVMRQGDKTFQAALNVLRYGEEHRYDGVLKWLNKRVNRNYDRSMFTVATYNKAVDAVNRKVLDFNPNDKYVYGADVEGTFSFKENNVEEDITLCVGLECITLVNDQEGQYFNGSFCTITSLTSEGCYCYFPHIEDEVFVPLHGYEQTESYVEPDVIVEEKTIYSLEIAQPNLNLEVGEVCTVLMEDYAGLHCKFPEVDKLVILPSKSIDVEGNVNNTLKVKEVIKKDVLKKRSVGTCSQIPLLQSSAFSCHRSQGRTFSKDGVLNMGFGFREDSDFGTALLYVALSRWTDVEMINLPSPLTKKHIKVCRESIEFYKECMK